MSETTGKNSVSSLKSVCQARLDELVRSLDGLQLAVIASDNGFPLASLNLESREGRKVTAEAGVLGDAARKACIELQLQGLQAAQLETDDGMLIYRLVENRVLPLMLLVVIKGDAGGGYAQWSVRRCATELAFALNELADGMARSEARPA